VSGRLRIAVYYNVGWGGGRRWLYECVSRLSAFHDIDLWCIDRDSLGPQYPDVREFALRSRAVAFRDLPRLRGPLKPLNAPMMVADLLRFERASRRIAAEIDAAGYDLLFASVGGYSEAPLVLRHARTRSAYYCHEPMRSLYEPQVARPYLRRPGVSQAKAAWHRFFTGGIIRRWDRQATRRAGLVIANSAYTRDYARRAYGVDAAVNYPGVDTDAFRPGDEPEERFVLSVGELIPPKGFDWSVRAMAAIPAGRRPKLVWAGHRADPREKAYVQALAAAAGVDLELRERVPDAEMKRLLRTAAVGLYTPHLEPFGLAVIESMASGTPVVAVGEAGPLETVVDGETGFLRPRDARELGAAVQRLLEDDALRARMGRAAREHAVRTWTWDRSVEQLQALLAGHAEGERAGAEQPAAVDPRREVAAVRSES